MGVLKWCGKVPGAGAVGWGCWVCEAPELRAMCDVCDMGSGPGVELRVVPSQLLPDPEERRRWRLAGARAGKWVKMVVLVSSGKVMVPE